MINKLLKILIILSILFLSVSMVSANEDFDKNENYNNDLNIETIEENFETTNANGDIDFTTLNDTIYSNVDDNVTVDLSILGNVQYNSTTDGNFIDGIIINKNVTIKNGLINASDFARMFNVTNTGNLVLDNITLINGFAANGSAIYNTGNLTLLESTLTNNNASDDGTIFNGEDSNLYIYDSVFSDNIADRGGAIYTDELNSVNVYIENTNFITNKARLGAALQTRGGTITINGSAFLANEASNYGGAIHATNSLIDIISSVFIDNNASSYGGAISSRTDSITTISYSIIYNNFAPNNEAIYSDSGTVTADNNFWGNNNPNFTDLISSSVIVDSFWNVSLILNETDDVLYLGEDLPYYVDFTLNGTSDSTGFDKLPDFYVTLSNNTDDIETFSAKNAIGDTEITDSPTFELLLYYYDNKLSDVFYDVRAENPINIILDDSYSGFYDESITINGTVDGLLATEVIDLELYINDTYISTVTTELDGNFTFTVNYPTTGLFDIKVIYNNTLDPVKKYSNNETDSLLYLKTYTQLNITVLNKTSKYNSKENITINVTLFDIYNDIGLNDTVNITVDGVTQNVTISDGYGQVQFNTSGLVVDNYPVDATYYGDSLNGPSFNNTESFDITPSSTILDIFVLNNVTYGAGENVTVNITLIDEFGYNVSGIIRIETTSGFDDYVTITDGIGQVNITTTSLNGGFYFITATYPGSQNYLMTMNTTENFTVKRAISNLNVSVDDIEFGDNVTVNITLTDVNSQNLTGNVNITIYNGTEYVDSKIVTVNNGVGQTIFENLYTGSYNIIAFYEGNINYNNATNDTESFTVGKTNSILDIIVLNNATFASDDYIFVNLTLFDKWGIGINGIVLINVSSIPGQISVNVQDGLGHFNISTNGLAGGDYNIYANYTGDESYNFSFETDSFTIIPADTILDIIVLDNVTYGDLSGVIINITLKDQFGNNVTGTVFLLINGTSIFTSTNIVNGLGQDSLSIISLGAGEYTIIARYWANENYTASETTELFTIEQANPTINVTVEDIDYGENVTINITVIGVNGELLNGTVNVTTIGINYLDTQEVNFVNGEGNLTIPDLNIGSYYIFAYYPGNANYTSALNNTEYFIVRKINSKINITIDDIIYGEEAILNATVTGLNDLGLNGTLWLNIDGNLYSFVVVNGSVIEAIDYFAVGDYNVEAYFIATNYDIIPTYSNFTVSKANSNLYLSIDDAVYNTNAIVTAYVIGANGELLSGLVSITVNNNDSYVIEVIDGMGNVSIAVLPFGSLNIIDGIYLGDYNHYYDTDSINFEIEKATPSIAISVEDNAYGSNSTVYVNLTGANGDLINDNVTLFINGKDYIVNITNGTGNVTIDILPVGTYYIDYNFTGNGFYNEIDGTVSFDILRAESSIDTYTDNNITYGESAVIEIWLIGVNSELITGKVNLTIIGENYNDTQEIDVYGGFAQVLIDNLNTGIYNVTVSYPGNQNYTSSRSNQISFEVLKANSYLIITVSNVVYGENVTIYVSLNGPNGNLSGDVYLEIGLSTPIVVEVVNGTGVKVVSGLDAGDYDYIATYRGDDNYNPSDDSGNFSVDKANSNLIITVSNIVYGDNLTIFVSLNGNGPLSGDVYLELGFPTPTLVNVVNGTGFVVFENLAAGDYDVIATYRGDDNYYDSNDTASFTVNKSISSIIIDLDNSTYGENTTINVVLPSDAKGNITVIVGTEDFVVELVNGTASIPINNYNAGEYPVTVIYDGDDNYLNNNASSSLTINKADSNADLTTDDINASTNETLSFVVDPNLTGNLTLSINNVTYTAEADNGYVNFTNLNLPTGNYTADLTYAGDNNFNGFNNSYNFTVSGIYFVLNADNVLMFYKNGTRFFAVLTDSNGNALANYTLYITVNGVTYPRVTDENGTVSLNLNLLPNNYTVTTFFNGTGTSGNITVISNLTILTTLISNGDIIKYYRNGTQYQVKVLDANGNPLVNASVTFNVHGVFYTRITNSEGIATLTINLNPGNYTITAMYNGLNLSNNIQVLPTLIGEDVDKKFNESKAYEVKVLDANGNPYANQTVEVNIHGVFYNIVSGSDGIAKLNINLNPGSYIATASWNGYQTSNLVKVE